ncbi:MAG TPA: enoyl-CoA hydratase/isomerase family protein [Actinomycetota bacterium]|nr:enoyl-CoA hydratase/isomerase family protein [Actinomycetota bacterium]
MIDLSFDEGIAILRIERGPVNALDAELLAGIAGALDEIEAASARAAVVTGSGAAFSAGADLIRLLDEGAAYVEAARPYASLVFRRMFLMPIPMIAAINGHAIAGGFVLALACDHRVSAAGNHRIGLPELRVGVPFPMWALEIVRFTVSPPHLQRMLYSGRLADPDEAMTMGLIDDVVAPEALMEAALRAARRLAAIPPATFALTKSALREPFAERARGGEARDEEGMRIWASEEARAAVQRFIERTLGGGRTERPDA